MTANRRDSHSTEFGLWLREQPIIDSNKGYLATNIDYMWRNYRTGQWMLIEEKRHNCQPKRWQLEMFKVINWCAKHHPKFRGFHIIVFENTNPDDGKIFIDGVLKTKDELLSFLVMA